jgi:hypothetical protein
MRRRIFSVLNDNCLGRGGARKTNTDRRGDCGTATATTDSFLFVDSADEQRWIVQMGAKGIGCVCTQDSLGEGIQSPSHQSDRSVPLIR